MRSLVVEVLPGYEHLVYVVVRDANLERLTEPLALSTSKQSRITHRGWLRLSQAAIDAALEDQAYRPFKQGHYRPADAEALHLVVRGYGESAEASLRAMITADEPWFRISGAEFSDLVGGVSYAALKELIAPWDGIALETREGCLSVAATDNHRAAHVELNVDAERSFKVRLVRHAALAVSRLMRDEQIEVLTGPGAVEFRTERISVITMPFHKRYGYPDISKLFAAERTVAVHIPRPLTFEAELLRVATGAHDDMVTLMGAGGGLVMMGVHPQMQIASPATDVTVEGGDFRVMLNYCYLREVVQRARGGLVMWVGGPLEHVLLQSADSPVQHAIMPARRNEFAGGVKQGGDV